MSELIERRHLPAGTPILLDDQMRPIEPVSSWFRSLGLDAKDADTMSTYAYAVLMLLGFLAKRGLDLASATETDIQDFRQWRTRTQKSPVQKTTMTKDKAAIKGLYGYLKKIGAVDASPWRSGSLGDRRVARDMRVRHMELEQYLYFRDVGFGGLVPDGGLDLSFRGWRPHRNRAVCELALMTGMRIQEWSTLLLPELGLLGGRRPLTTEVDLSVCAKGGYQRTVYIPMDAMELLDPYLLLERPLMVAAAQRTLRKKYRDLFVVDRVESDGERVAGVFEGRRVTWVVKEMDPDFRRLCVMETGDGLNPMAVFLGRGGRMPTFSGWDRARWRAWDRMKELEGDPAKLLMPRRRWVYHDLRHTFALRLLIFLTREALKDSQAQELPMSTLLDHMLGNPLLAVQRRLGHERPSTTYKYIRYLKDPMQEVDAAFREWTAAGGASYAAIAQKLMGLEGSDASEG
ncbi:tyrosine-type recombinase/integrase [Streptomyces sp. BpilaLS-43]|uniref:tyrosine-type recombinase/integrase n=1 Tax=Streptomyces sp. BpilaLS-43 TaxID=1839778 RepID=UPI00114D2C7C|nr:site-specific integrase [Streptomyces sp. BpilaLS-43]